MCDIWKETSATELSVEELELHTESMKRLGVEWVVFSGGEPLMHSDLFRLGSILKTCGIRLTLLTTGLLVERNAAAIAEMFDEVIVSLDGPAAIHDQVRRVPQAYRNLEKGVRALRALRTDLVIGARCTVQKTNAKHLHETALAARSMRLTSISFLAADVTSTAFNRPNGWTELQIAGVAPDSEALAQEIERLIGDPELQGFVLESPSKLRRISNHFRKQIAPQCNAPWVSAVMEADGTVRPCFFHPPIGKASPTMPLIDIINSPAAVAFREQLDVARNPICRRCVCSLNWRG
jgi:MoaA/NifB/PqqE/SkfB family radical SAM enzyme